jgi:hypothetical protein
LFQPCRRVGYPPPREVGSGVGLDWCFGTPPDPLDQPSRGGVPPLSGGGYHPPFCQKHCKNGKIATPPRGINFKKLTFQFESFGNPVYFWLWHVEKKSSKSPIDFFFVFPKKRPASARKRGRNRFDFTGGYPCREGGAQIQDWL